MISERRKEKLRTAADELVSRLRRRSLLRPLDSIVLYGSAVKPSKDSRGKDVDLDLYWKEGISRYYMKRIENVMRRVERKHKTFFDSIFLTPKEDKKLMMRYVARLPHEVLYSDKESEFLRLREKVERGFKFRKRYLRRMDTFV
jgi:hypothetical protein